MKGDFSNSTFRPEKHFTGVRMQQGRIQLDADWNEQVDIFNHRLASQAMDVIGQAGATAGAFQITVVTSDSEDANPIIKIAAGSYYVDGTLCVNDGAAGTSIFFTDQPNLPPDISREDLQNIRARQAALVYLDVWQRHITMYEDPDLQETALGGIDTTTRTKTVWQVRLMPVVQNLAEPEAIKSQWKDFIECQKRRGRLQIRQCGSVMENQLYRVEVHSADASGVTLKWAADNASTVVLVKKVHPQHDKGDTSGIWTLTVENLPTTIGIGDCLELEDDSSSLSGRLWFLANVTDLNRQDLELTIKVDPPYQPVMASLADHQDPSKPLLLRRWEQKQAGMTLSGPEADNNWTKLNSAIDVRLAAAKGGELDDFHPGDYWWIPVRVDPATNGELLLPTGGTEGLPPNGIDHHYAPLALIYCGAENIWMAEDWRPEFFPMVDMSRHLAAYQKTTSEKLQALQDETRQQLEQYDIRLQQLQAMIKTVVEAALDDAANRISLEHDFRAVHNIDKGHVVALAVDHEVQAGEHAHVEHLITLSSSEKPTLILGVVSQTPTFHTGEARYTVTTYGQTTCLVTGRVNPGDLLVPSNVDGYARRAGLYIQPGTVIGKALSSFRPTPEDPDLTGEVDILVMLG